MVNVILLDIQISMFNKENTDAISFVKMKNETIYIKLPDDKGNKDQSTV